MIAGDSVLNIGGMKVSLVDGRRVVLRRGRVYLHIEAGLRSSPDRERGTGTGKRSPDPIYSPLEVWLWDNRGRLFSEALKDPGASWRQVAIRAGVPNQGVLSCVTAYTVAHAARVDGRRYPYRSR